ncbi:MAG TPA: cbb3-type cytochrome c oxidase subunit I [Solirubrobacteraceae bacterium]|nr:cbb3-type cytochrome c oxidase subunit I [Solirubrobacteraceae bacterium]
MSATLPAPGVRRGARLLGLLSSTDHKHLGLLVCGGAFVFFCAGGLLAVLMRSELAAPELQVISKEAYNQVFTMHGSTMFYLFSGPMALGFGLYLVPLQIGAGGLKWPRLALLGFWLFLGAGLLMYAGFLTNEGAGRAGWFAFDPLSDDVGTPGTGMDLWVIAVILAALAGMLWAASILATIIRRRTPDMTMLRLPVFTWSMVVTCLLTLVAFPALLLAMGLLFLERHGLEVFSQPGGAIFYQHLFWFFGHPLVYIVFFPFLAAASEAIATSAGQRFFGYKFFVGSLLVFAALTVGVWGHHMFVTSSVDNRFFSLTTTAIIVVAGVEYFDNLATMFRGRIKIRASFLFACGFLVTFLIGGLSGIWVASPPLDYNSHDTYSVVGHFHYTLFGGTVFGMFAGIYHWFPKITGRLLGERLGRWHFWLMLLGGLVTFIPQFFLGEQGMVRRIADYPQSEGWTTLNALSTIGAFIILLSLLIFVANLLRSLRLGKPGGPDPWDGHTLEWATSSPPPRYNFAAVPPVRSYAPLLDLKQETDER